MPDGAGQPAGAPAVVPGSSVLHTLITRLWALRVLVGRASVVLVTVSVRRPFPHIARHIHRSVGAGSFRIAAHRRGVPVPIVVVRIAPTLHRALRSQ